METTLTSGWRGAVALFGWAALRAAVAPHRLYLLAFGAGTLLPLLQFGLWLLHQGPDVALFFGELDATAISRFFKWDALMGMAALLVLVVVETRRLQVRHAWLAVVAGCVVGVSSGLPLFLYLRELRLRELQPAAPNTPT